MTGMKVSIVSIGDLRLNQPNPFNSCFQVYSREVSHASRTNDWVPDVIPSTDNAAGSISVTCRLGWGFQHWRVFGKQGG